MNADKILSYASDVVKYLDEHCEGVEFDDMAKKAILTTAGAAYDAKSFREITLAGLHMAMEKYKG